MEPPFEQVPSPVFGAMIGMLTGRKLDLSRVVSATLASASHSLWEGEDAFDADEPGACRRKPQPTPSH